MKILFVASEGLPFSKTGGLADVVEALPKCLVDAGHDVAVVLPRYRGIKTSTVIEPSLSIALGASMRFPAVADGALVNGVRYYFVDDPEYFDREALYATKSGDYPDNGERFALFSKAAIEIAKHVYRPDVIHCHDWQTALVPVTLRSIYSADPLLRGIPTVFTIHNMGYHGNFPRELLSRIGLPDHLFHMNALEFYGRLNLLKGGILYSEYLTTVSPTYAREIMTPEYGHGLDGVVRSRSDRLVGILNGVDYAAWSPETDKLIAANYSAKDLSGKTRCKKELLHLFRLPTENLKKPVMGIVSRFVDQKGFDLIAQVAYELMANDFLLVALGTGTPAYENLFRALAATFPQKVGVRIAYDDAVAHKIEAGSDLFLMPSRYEPCGLNQIYSLRYGTVPIVRATGGLEDTIQHYQPFTGKGNGFKFSHYDGRALLGAVREALEAFADSDTWRKIMLNGMKQDFSWKKSAAEYVKLYEQARQPRIPRSPTASN
jgi:starch synthase